MGSSVSQHNLRLHLYSKLFSFKWCGNLKGLSSETETAKRGRGENVDCGTYLLFGRLLLKSKILSGGELYHKVLQRNYF